MNSLLRTIFLSLVLSIMLPMAPVKAALPLEVRNDSEFITWLTDMTTQVAKDKHYQRIPLDSEPLVDEFTVALHEVFRGRTTDADFSKWVAGRYPGHAYETATILMFLNAHWKERRK